MCLCAFRCLILVFLFFKQKTAYEMSISDWSSDVCSSDLAVGARPASLGAGPVGIALVSRVSHCPSFPFEAESRLLRQSASASPARSGMGREEENRWPGAGRPP